MQIEIERQSAGARVDISENCEDRVPSHVPPHLEIWHVEGFLLLKHFCSRPRHHLYHQFANFPSWPSSAAAATNIYKPPESLLSSVDEEVWKEFCHAFLNDLKAGKQNIAASIIICGLVYYSEKFDPFFVCTINVIVLCIIYEELKPSLFDKIDRIVAGFQTQFAEKGIKASVVCYTVNPGKIDTISRYIVFTALLVAHPQSLNLV